MLRVLADAEASPVPRDRKSNVTVLSDNGICISAIGNTEYAVVVVSTIRNVSRGFDSARYEANILRAEVRGSVAEKFDSCDEASSGMEVDAAELDDIDFGVRKSLSR